MQVALVLYGLFAAAVGKELTPESWDKETSGKTVFVKFFAPWCGHCKAMKPAWDQLMAEFAKDEHALVADVDCTSDGKPLCDENGVQGFPSIKWGDPNALEGYDGGRDFDALSKFARENLKPMCSVANINLCDAEKKALIEEYQAMSAQDLTAKLSSIDKEMKDVNEAFEKQVEELRAKYGELEKMKTEQLSEIQKSGLGLLKSVLAFKRKEEL